MTTSLPTGRIPDGTRGISRLLTPRGESEVVAGKDEAEAQDPSLEEDDVQEEGEDEIGYNKDEAGPKVE